MKIRYTDRTPQDITKHKVQKDWASAIKVSKPFETGFPSKAMLVFFQVSFVKRNFNVADKKRCL